MRCQCPAVQDLRAKTRIHVPDSALLMGVMDEFGVLKYGEVYLAINPDPASELPRTITGGVVVAKNPCFHPGDVRRFKVRACTAGPLRCTAPEQATGCNRGQGAPAQGTHAWHSPCQAR